MQATDTPAMVYLAEPIDQADGAGAKAVALGGAALWDRLTNAGHTVFRPKTGFRADRPDHRIEKINRHALYQSDVIVAHLPAGVPSIGVPAEIEAATARGIPAVVLHDGTSQALAGNPLVTVIANITDLTPAVWRAIENHPRAGEPDGALRLVIRDGWGDKAPTRTYPDDAGVDLTTAIGVTIPGHGYADIHTQVVACELPTGYWGLVTGRSSTVRTRDLFVPPGVIDPGWRGPLFVGALNLTGKPITVKVGDRIGQLILIPNNPATIAAVTEVGNHARGTNGFGSSGV